LDWNFLFGEALDFHHEAFFVQANQTDRFTARTGATGTADAVQRSVWFAWTKKAS